MNDNLRQLLTKHEGKRLRPYYDEMGKITIGIGRNLTDVGISEEECEMFFENDVSAALAHVENVFPEYSLWAEARQDAMIDMVLNVGIGGLMGFKNMIDAIHAEDWGKAASEMRNSLWAHQVPKRAEELARMVESGEYQTA